MTTHVDPDLYAKALAEVRALRSTRPAEAPKPPASPDCYCSGTRSAYWLHVKHREPTCAASRAAHAAYMRGYEPAYRARRKAARAAAAAAAAESGGAA